TLYHAITNAGDRKESYFVAALLRYLLFPRPQRHISALDQFVPDLLKEAFHALLLDGLKRDSVTARSPIIDFGHRVRAASPSCRRGRTDPRNASAVQPSPWRISSVSGPAN